MSLLKIPSLIAKVLAGFLLGFSELTLVGVITSLFQKMNMSWLYLTIQSVILFLIVIAWFGKRKPTLFLGFKSFVKELQYFSIKKATIEFPFVLLMSLCAIGAYTLNLVLIWVVAPNSSDSMHTHLSRVGYWLQHGSMLPWATLNPKQVFYPINVSLQTFWTILFWGSDRLVGYVQWVGAVVTILTVFGLARLLNANRVQSAFASVVWSSFTIVLMQSTSSQIDLSSSALFMVALYFLIFGIRKENKLGFIFSGLGLALALGAKQIIFFYLPGLALFAIINLKYWRKHISHLVHWAVSTVVLFLLLSSYIYVINYKTYGNIAGPSDVVDSSVGRDFGTLKYNIPRLIYQSVDFSGLPTSVANLGNRLKAKIMEGVEILTGYTLEVATGISQDNKFLYRDFIQPTEDTSWFGFSSVAILLPAVLLTGWKAIKKKDSLSIGLLLISISFLPINAFLRWGWDPYQGRYFIVAVGILAPFMFLVIKKTKVSMVFQAFALLVVIFSFATILLGNPTKPLKSNDVEIFNANREKLQSLAGGRSLWRFSYMIDRSLPVDATIAYYAPNLIYDYILFGEHFTRRVIQITSVEELQDEAWLKTQGIQYVLVDVSRGIPLQLQQKLIPYDEVKGEWLMYTWSKVQ
jgi:4-amino-4-deoxy-L-arabinose transferase-like glycosyltransferase